MLIQFIRIIAFVTFLAAAGFCSKLAISDFYFDRAKNSYNKLDFNKLNTKNELVKITSDLTLALKWRATNSEAQDLFGKLLYQQWWLFPDGQYLETSSLLNKAKKMHLDALKQRPTWAFSAAHLMQIYSHQEKRTKDFEFWFDRAYELGRYETGISLLMAKVGLENWGEFTLEQRNKTIDLIRISIEKKRNKPRDIRSLLLAYEKLEMVCSSLIDTPRQTLVCLDSKS